MFSPAEEPEYLLPQEAFPLRHEIMDHPSAPEPMQEKPESPHVSGNEAESVCLTPMESISLISVSQLQFSPYLPPKFFCPIVKEMLCYYAEQGDVQMAVSVLIVLGDRIRKEIDELTQVKKNAHFDRKCRFLHVRCIRNRPLYPQIWHYLWCPKPYWTFSSALLFNPTMHCKNKCTPDVHSTARDNP